ncbi:MAG TPA: DUF2934 domain-containing protein [Rhodocyclaceae bacterium]
MKSKAKRSAISAAAAPSVIADRDAEPGEADRLTHIATAAYYKAESRGFMPGQELDDWLEAEAEFEERQDY